MGLLFPGLIFRGSGASQLCGSGIAIRLIYWVVDTGKWVLCSWGLVFRGSGASFPCGSAMRYFHIYFEANFYTVAGLVPSQDIIRIDAHICVHSGTF